MPRWRLFYHAVWATRRREPVLDAAMAASVVGYITSPAREPEMIVHAVGTMPDHVHVAASIPPAEAIGSVVGRWKGGTSHLLNHGASDEGRPAFAWQPEYGVTSFGEKNLPDVIAYVEDQTARHAAERTWASLERFDDGYHGSHLIDRSSAMALSLVPLAHAMPLGRSREGKPMVHASPEVHESPGV